jgi:hypothetical protein
MDDISQLEETENDDSATLGYEAPGFHVISLACEISAYAPDDGGDDLPLF